MKHTNDLEHSIENLRATTSSDTDQRILTDASAALAQSTQIAHPTKHPNLWIRRTVIMKKHWTKFAAVAAVLAVAVLGSWLFQTSPDMARSAYAELAQAFDNISAAEWVHVDVEGFEIRECWISFRPYRQCYATAKQVIYEDGSSGRQYSYDQSSQTITVELLDSDADIRERSSFLSVISTMIDTWRKAGAEVLENRKTVEGKDYNIYTAKYTKQPKEGLLEVTIDSETKQIVLVRFVGGSLSEPVTWRLDYPETGPADIYALGVPRDAKIVDRTDSHEAEESE